MLEEPANVGRHNLPAVRTSFVGRRKEMIEVKRALAMTRLLTLTGTGGSGKTRLALEVARDLVRAYPDGVWLVELAPLSEDGLVPKAVAEAIGISEQPGRQITDALLQFMRGKEQLLIVDNCEHLVEATARLVDVLLDGCPRLRVLATSRESLRIAGEFYWPVPSLSVPGEQSSTVEEVEGHESARLFAARASYRRLDFSVTPENARAVATICRRLDGIPLAIELAAARVGPLSVEQIARRLDDSLKLLTGGSRTAVPRHRTLRGALDWSHELLSGDEKKLFGRLSVFRGGWTLEAAEAVGAGGSVEEDEVLDLLSGLVDKSLVVVRGSDEGGVRYRSLEPVRQYALEKLEQSGEAEAARRAHAAFFLALAEEGEPELTGPDQREWLGRLETEHDNLRAALSWVLERRETELALRLGGALWRFWLRGGYWREGRGWLRLALAQDDAVASAVRAKALIGMGRFIWQQGDYEEIRTLFREALRLYRKAGDELGVADALENLGWTALSLGDHKRAVRLLEDALRRYRRSDDKFGAAQALLTLGHTASSSGDYEQAQMHYQESLGLFREVEDQAYVALCLWYLGWMAWRRGERDLAARLMEEGLERHRGVYASVEPVLLLDLAHVAMSRDDPVRAKTLLDEGFALARRSWNKPDLVITLEGMAMIAGVRGEAERMARLWGVAQASREDMNSNVYSDQPALYEPYLDAARAKLGEAAWEAALARGRVMTLEEAVEYALSEEEPAMPMSPAPAQTSNDAQPLALTRREDEVATLVARGLTNRQIASELSISEHTVHHHVTNILKKLNLNSRQQVASRLHDR